MRLRAAILLAAIGFFLAGGYDRTSAHEVRPGYLEIREGSSGRYDVLWKARGTQDTTLTVRIELRGLFEGKHPREVTLERTLEGRSSQRRWTGLELTGDAYTRFGKITAWRATLWCDDVMLDEYRSFLW